MFTSKNKNEYGEDSHEVYVMSYHEFGIRIQDDDTFEDVNFIYCNGIHSLIEYRNYNNITYTLLDIYFKNITAK